MVDERSLLKHYTKDYKLPIYNTGLYNAYLNPQRPIFFRSYIPIMLRDPDVWYGMELLKGPIISKAKYEVICDQSEVGEYIDRQLRRFWARGIDKALDCLAWGYAGSEVLYEFNQSTSTVDFKDLKYIHPRDLKVITKNGDLAAIKIKKTGIPKDETYLQQPKFLWTVHDKKTNRWYGRSRLEAAFDSWWEMWQPRGFRGIRHLWFYKNAFISGCLYYPNGSTQDPETGEEVPNVKIASEMLDKVETGASLALPSMTTGTGTTKEWEWMPASGNAIPEGLMEYGDSLRDEIWKGIGIPPEIAKQEDTGSFAGRRVPQQAFYSYIQQIANEICYDYDEQIIKPLVELAYGPGVSYDIEPISILQTLQEEEMGAVTGSLPGDEEEEQQFDEEGNPIEDEEMGDEEEPLSNGRIEDRDSNAFNITEKAQKQNRGKK